MTHILVAIFGLWLMFCFFLYLVLGHAGSVDFSNDVLDNFWTAISDD